MTIQDVRNKVEAKKAEETQRQAKIEQLKADLITAENQATEAARSGDFELYSKAKANRAELELKIDFIEKSTAAGITKEELEEAWESIATANAKKMAKAKAQFEKVKAQYSEAYTEMIKIQTEAIRLREELGSYIGIHYDGIGDANNTYTMFPLKEQIDDKPSRLHFGQSSWTDPDACYFLVDKWVTYADDLYRLVHHHTL